MGPYSVEDVPCSYIIEHGGGGQSTYLVVLSATEWILLQNAETSASKPEKEVHSELEMRMQCDSEGSSVHHLLT